MIQFIIIGLDGSSFTSYSVQERMSSLPTYLDLGFKKGLLLFFLILLVQLSKKHKGDSDSDSLQ